MNAKRRLKDKILPCYLHLFEDNDINIEFIWGTRDSGKSKAAGQLIIYDYSKIEKDFKGVLIRKVKDTIKDSIYTNVVSVIDEWKLSEYFDTTKSPLEIRSKINNGIFICRGLDEVGKLKSLSNPTHALIEEGDQVTADDFTTILTTFRHNTIKPKFYFLFNPELPVGILKKEDWWVYKDWFSHTSQLNFTNVKEISYTLPDGTTDVLRIKYRSTHTTFEQNPYCPPERKAHYHNLQFTNPAKYLPYAKGLWGNKTIDNPFFYSYVSSRHYKTINIEPNRNLTLDISFDFNIDPCTAVIGQYDRVNYKFWVLDVITANPQTMQGKSPLEAVCAMVQRKYISSGMFTRDKIRVTGDASGKNGTADNVVNHSFYTTIKRELSLYDSQVVLRAMNTPHQFSGEVINYFLRYCDFYHNNNQLDNDITISFNDGKDSLNEAKKKHGLHILDAWRYLVDYWICNLGGYTNDYSRIRGAIDSSIKKYNG